MGAFTACQSNEIAAEKNLPQVSCTQTLGKSTWKDDEKDPDFIHLSGLLIAPETEKGMIISVKGTNISIKPNLTNNFEVYLDSSWKHKEIELIISSTHYKEIRYIVQQGDFQGMIRIEVETGKVDAPSKRFHMVGEVVPKLK